MNEKGITTIEIKKMNKKNVYQYIYKMKKTSKLQIVHDLQMGLSTVSQNLNLLEKEGLIKRNGYFESTGGRKAQMIQIVSDVKLSIGIGILKNTVHIAAVNLYGEVISSKSISLPYHDSGNYYDQLAETIEHFLIENHYNVEKISGISIATQGIISPDGSAVTYGVIMENMRMRLFDFSSRLSYPCHLEHDSKAAAYLELWNHPSLDSAVVFLLNPNLGGAIITNHTVHQGVSMHSGSIEHLCLDPNGPLCYCGNHGCLETFCSANALETAAGMPVEKFFTSLRSKKDEHLLKIWDAYLDHLAFAMRNLNTIIDSPIILSGDLAPYLLLEDLDELLNKMNGSLPFTFSRNHLLVGTCGQYTAAVGAALYYVEEFIRKVC